MRPILLAVPMAFVSSRWSGRVPVAQLLWNDMIVTGTTVNIVAAVLGLILFTQEAPTALGAAVYFAPLPYNAFLFAALWRAAAHADDAFGAFARIVGTAWFLVMLIL